MKDRMKKMIEAYARRCYKAMELNYDKMLYGKKNNNKFSGLSAFITNREKTIDLTENNSMYDKVEILKRTFSNDFIKKMKNRILVSYCKYGDLRKAKKDLKNHRDELKNAEYRIKRYKETGNLEYIIDAANFVMFE